MVLDPLPAWIDVGDATTSDRSVETASGTTFTVTVCGMSTEFAVAERV
jgi:hypothetical protein